MKKSLLFLSILLFSFPSIAQNITGDWYGILNAGGQQLSLVLHIQKMESGYESTVDSPDQHANGIPVSKTTFQDDSLILDLSTLGATYTAKFNKETHKFKGFFTQVGQSFPLDFFREKVAKAKSKRPQEPKKPYPYHSKDITFYNEKGRDTLAGTFTWPEKGREFPAVILISGSGPQNRDEELLGHKPFLVIADYLTRHGIAVLRYDDRGTAESTGSFDGSTTADFANDADAAFAYLRARKEVNKREIGLIGHSEGGEIAPMIAARNKHVAFIVLLAGPGVSGADLLLKQQKLIGKAEEKPEDFLKNNTTINKKAYALIKTTEDSVKLRKKLKTYFQKAVKKYPNWNSFKNKGFSDDDYIQKVLITYMTPWMRYFLRYDPAAVLEQVDCPVLALNGSKDLQVDADQNLLAIKEALAKGGNQNVTVKKLDGLNHLFQKSKTGSPMEYQKIEQTFSPKALKIIEDWILENK